VVENAPALAVSKAAEHASTRTANAIEEAIEINDDPRVAKVLDDASDQAEATVRRVGWVRHWIERLFGASGAEPALRRPARRR
jgi:hypothetical protein